MKKKTQKLGKEVISGEAKNWFLGTCVNGKDLAGVSNREENQSHPRSETPC
jgi:hypothetical protein